MSIGPPIPEIQHFQNLTLKIKGQCHGWGHSLKSHCESNILSTHIPFVPCQSSIPFLSYDFFKIWPWKSRVKVMGEVTVQSHNVGVASYRLIYLSFHVDQPSHSWDTAFSKFDLENQGSRLWLRSQFKVTMWVQHPIDSHPFCSMSIGHPIPELWLFQNLTLKIKGQGHGWGHVQSHNVGLAYYRLTSLSFHVNRPSHSWDTAFSKFDLENQGSRSWLRGEVTVQSHNVGLISYRLISLSFHFNQPSHSWDTTFSKFDLENQGSRSYDPGVAQLQV